jgi:N-formylglutamate amidohydrolase
MILHIPHASRRIPEFMRNQFVLKDEQLEQEQVRLTDAFTDELFHYPAAQTIRFPYSRLVVDVERFADDGQEPMSRVGMGRFYLKTTDGRPLRRALKDDELELLDGYYSEHHQKLTAAVGRELKQPGRALIIDCHSFPGAPLPCDLDKSVPRPDFCIGTDAFHTPDGLVQTARQLLEKKGYSTEINRPYAGTLVPLTFYRQDARVSSIMIEVNRKLYMDEATGEKTTRFDEIRQTAAELLSLIKGI